MTVEAFDPQRPITLTTAAQQHFEQALAAQPGKLLRLSTRESGCTGYAYVLDLVDEAQPGDEIIQPGGEIQLAVDRQALAIIRGTQIDLVVEGINRVVKFNNPNVVAECGCGESFSVA